MRSHFHDYTRTPDEQPRVDVLICNSRGADSAWLKEAVESVERQSYPNTGLWVIDNNDRALEMGAAWNIGVNSSTAPLVLILREEDGITADLVETLVTFYALGKRQNPSLAHVTTYTTILDDETGRTGSAPLAHAGMFERERLIAHPFNKDMGRGIDAELLQRLRASVSAEQEITFGVAHHHGYIWRNHTFRIDRVNVNP